MKTPPRALVIAPQPFFTPRGTPFSVYYRTLACAEAGLAMDLVTYGEGDDVDIPGLRILRAPRFRWLGPVPIGPSKLKLFLDVFVFARALGLLLTRRYAFVHAHEEAVFFAALLKPLLRFKFVYDMHSSLPQQLTNFRFTRSRLLIGLFRWLEDLAIARADAIVTICPDLRDYVLSRIRDPARHILIENSLLDPVRLRGAPVADSAAAAAPTPPAAAVDADAVLRQTPPNRRLVVYAGTFEPYQGLDILVRAFPLVRQTAPDAFLLAVGGTPDQVRVCRSLADVLGVTADCLFLERMPQAAARGCVAAAHVQVSPRSAGTNTPLKTYEQLASGVPLVATRIYSHTQVLTDEVAYLAEPTPGALADAMVQALRDGRQGNPRAAAAVRLYEERYSRPAYERKIRQLLGVLGLCVE
jgi:glycosyltransferase involved in cell wall biosynthesis